MASSKISIQICAQHTPVFRIFFLFQLRRARHVYRKYRYKNALRYRGIGKCIFLRCRGEVATHPLSSFTLSFRGAPVRVAVSTPPKSRYTRAPGASPWDVRELFPNTVGIRRGLRHFAPQISRSLLRRCEIF